MEKNEGVKKILMLTSIYPLPSNDNRGTRVCHYFTVEWLKMGLDVRVIHFQAVYPKPLYWAARLARNRIVAKTSAIVYTEQDKGANYEMDGVKVRRIPLYKPIPHGKFSKKGIEKSINEIKSWLVEDGFIPDIIVGHFPNPQIEVVNSLKKIWPLAKTAIVMHIDSDISTIKTIYGKKFLEYNSNIDLWGFRNVPLRQLFEKQIMPLKKSFICYSGIPEDYITADNKHDFQRPFRKFIYVGEMIERKYPVEVLDALQKVYPNGDFQLSYVGQGELLKVINRRVQKENLSDKVNVLGKISRDKLKNQYDNADCMIMISRGEAYGLVYLEAMSRGCITIASRNEGFDGVIRNGENGFLCEAGNTYELVNTIKLIKELSPVERQQISNNAIETAKALTDFKAAKMYVEDLINK